NFSLTSTGDVPRQVIEGYVANQLGHHRMADEQVQSQLHQFRLSFPEVDLAEPVFSSHGRYVYNLHPVFVHDSRWCEVRLDCLAKTRKMVLGVAGKKHHRLS